MYRYGWKTVAERIELVRKKQKICRDVTDQHPYAAAILATLTAGSMQTMLERFRPDDAVIFDEFAAFCRIALGNEPENISSPITHEAAIRAISSLLDK